MPKNKRDRIILITTISSLIIVTIICICFILPCKILNLIGFLIIVIIGISMMLLPFGCIIYSIYLGVNEENIKRKKSEITFKPMTDDEGIKYKSVNEEDLKKIMPDYDMKEFINELYLKYVKIQDALETLCYDDLRKLCTDELYNTYIKQLEVQQLNKKFKFEKAIKYNWGRIVSISVENGLIIVKVRINLNYVIMTMSSNKLITEDEYMKYRKDTFELVFIKSASNEDENKCPNCGAPIKYITSIECPFCNSIIIKDASRFVLNSCNNTK